MQAIVDGTDGNSANVGMSYAEAVVLGYSQQIQLDWMRQKGLRVMDPPLAVDARTWFNEDLESMANIVPGVVAIVMAVVGTFLTSLTIAREWERGTMEQLISTPVSPLELMIGKLSPYLRHWPGRYRALRRDGSLVVWSPVPGKRGRTLPQLNAVSDCRALARILSFGDAQVATRRKPGVDDCNLSSRVPALRFYLSD